MTQTKSRRWQPDMPRAGDDATITTCIVPTYLADAIMEFLSQKGIDARRWTYAAIAEGKAPVDMAEAIEGLARYDALGLYAFAPDAIASTIDATQMETLCEQMVHSVWYAKREAKAVTLDEDAASRAFENMCDPDWRMPDSVLEDAREIRARLLAYSQAKAGETR